MRIQSADIRGFGILSDRKIDFSKDFLLLYGENESGKTTVLQFIRMMLYGGGAPLRTHYRPISGAVMGGSMVFEQDGKEYQLDRSFAKSKTGDVTVLTDLTTGKVQKLAANRQPGEIFLKIGEDTFVRSCFVGTLGSIAGEKGSEEIRRKLQNLISAGNDEISVSAVEKRLSDAAKLLQNRSETGGKIAQCSKELDKLCQSQKESERIEAQYIAENQKRDQIAARIQELEQILAALDEEKDDSTKEMLRQQIHALESQLTVDGEVTSRTALTELRGELQLLTERAHELGGYHDPYRDDEEHQRCKARYELSQEREKQAEQQYEQAKQAYERGSGQKDLPALLFNILGSVLLLGGIILLFFAKIPAILSLLAAAVLLTSGLYRLHNASKRKEKLKVQYLDAEIQLESAKTAVLTFRDQLVQLERDLHRSDNDRRAELDRLKSRVFRSLRKYGITESDQAAAALDSLIATHDRYTETRLQLLSLEKNLTPEQIAAEKELQKLRLEYATLTGILQTMPKPRSSAQLEEEIRVKRRRLSELKLQQEALALASRVLEESFEEMQKQFGGILNRETDRFLRILTDGKYDRSAIDRNLKLQARQQNSGRMTADTLLSAGTADQCYLALRLAITKLIAAQNGCSLPLFFDDSLIQYDDRRCESAMRLIHSLVKTPEFSQAIFFTCHKREAELYQKLQKESE